MRSHEPRCNATPECFVASYNNSDYFRWMITLFDGELHEDSKLHCDRNFVVLDAKFGVGSTEQIKPIYALLVLIDPFAEHSHLAWIQVHHLIPEVILGECVHWFRPRIE